MNIPKLNREEMIKLGTQKDNNKKEQVPIYQKQNLTIEEAAEYSNIGINRLSILMKRPDCDFVLYVGNTTIFALFDNLMDNIFMTLYFPNFITLFMVELISAIICLISFIKKGINKTNRIVNIVSFVIIQTIFVLILT